MIKTVKAIVILVIAMISFASCTTVEDSVDPAIVLKDIEITTTKTSSSILLSWKPVVGCSWYRISFAEHGQDLKAVATYQDLINNPIPYTLSDLKANTLYDIKMEGLDYASGGQLLATKSLSILTNR